MLSSHTQLIVQPLQVLARAEIVRDFERRKLRACALSAKGQHIAEIDHVRDVAALALGRVEKILGIPARHRIERTARDEAHGDGVHRAAAMEKRRAADEP